jgi:hypothetical protein
VGGLDPNLCPVTPAQPPVGEGGRLAIGGRGLVGDYSTRTVTDSLGTLVTTFANRTHVSLCLPLGAWPSGQEQCLAAWQSDPRQTSRVVRLKLLFVPYNAAVVNR